MNDKEKFICENSFSNNKNILKEIYSQIFLEIRNHREMEIKNTFYLSLILIGIFTTLINLLIHVDKFSEKIIDIKEAYEILGFINPFGIIVFIIMFLGFWGFSTLLGLKLRYSLMFSILRKIHQDWKINIPNLEYLFIKQGIDRFTQDIFSAFHLIWLPALAFADIYYIVQIAKLSNLYLIIILIFYIVICGISLFIALKTRKKFMKVNEKF